MDVGALKMAMSNLPSWGGFLHFIMVWMRGIHDLFRKRPSSLIMLLGWSSITIAPLMIQSIQVLGGEDSDFQDAWTPKSSAVTLWSFQMLRITQWQSITPQKIEYSRLFCSC
jgi:hypothetical protein